VSSKRLELILEALPNADREQLTEYLRARGFEPLPMTVGVLLSDDLEQLRSLWPTLVGAEQDTLEIPEGLKRFVRAVRIVKPRSFHGS
jgi:hypothetical protein